MVTLTAPRKVRYPALRIRWREVESSNVKRVGWDNVNGMYVEFLNGGMYLYHGVSRQQAVACAYAPSVGHYLAVAIKPVFRSTRLA